MSDFWPDLVENAKLYLCAMQFVAEERNSFVEWLDKQGRQDVVDFATVENLESTVRGSREVLEITQIAAGYNLKTEQECLDAYKQGDRTTLREVIEQKRDRINNTTWPALLGEFGGRTYYTTQDGYILLKDGIQFIKPPGGVPHELMAWAQQRESELGLPTFSKIRY
jgi:hypothetical protein